MRGVAELDLKFLDLAAATFHVNVEWPIDHDFADRRVAEKILRAVERARLVEHLVNGRSRSMRLRAGFGIAGVLDLHADLAAEVSPDR
ncbi:MAG: hypothetical protein U1D30_02055 [Planctomycetota bacterium]